MDRAEGVTLIIGDLAAGASSRIVAIRLASSPVKLVVRLTGGCGSLDARLVQQMYDSFETAFDGFSGTVIAGGTQMRRRHDNSVHPSITELLPRIAHANPRARAVGVVPRQTELKLIGGRLVVADKPANDHYTIIHPDLDTCLLLQYSADKALTNWDAEWRVSLEYMEALRQHAGFSSVHIVYGGGTTTEREVRHVLQLEHATNPWPVIIIADSGGVAERMANDTGFVAAHADRLIVCKAAELKQYIHTLPPAKE